MRSTTGDWNVPVPQSPGRLVGLVCRNGLSGGQWTGPAEPPEKGLGSKDGEKYLRLYGFFQAVVLQQDAIRYLYKEFVGRELKYSRPSGWNQIRELRNLTAGHPIKCGGHQKAFFYRLGKSPLGLCFR